MRRVLTTAALAFLPVASHAQGLPTTVAQMERACAMVSGESETTEPEHAIAAGACYGTMRGIVQVMKANCRSFGVGQRPAAALSIGEVPTAGHAIRAFDAWAEEHPDEADAPAEYGVIVALAQAFPCHPAVSGPAPTSGGTEQDPAAGKAAEDGEMAEPQ